MFAAAADAVLTAYGEWAAGRGTVTMYAEEINGYYILLWCY